MTLKKATLCGIIGSIILCIVQLSIIIEQMQSSYIISGGELLFEVLRLLILPIALLIFTLTFYKRLKK